MKKVEVPAYINLVAHAIPLNTLLSARLVVRIEQDSPERLLLILGPDAGPNSFIRIDLSSEGTVRVSLLANCNCKCVSAIFRNGGLDQVEPPPVENLHELTRDREERGVEGTHKL